MNNIKITDNKEEMIKIGKELMESKPHIYTEQVCNDILKTIDANMPNSTGVEKQDIFYRSIYNYWVYGFVIYEMFCYDIDSKSHDEKEKYITCKNRFLYTNHLNKVEDIHILNNKYETYQLLKPYYKRDVIEIASESDYDNFVAFVEKHPVFVAKPVGLNCAVGVRKVDSNEYPDKKTMFNQLISHGVNTASNYSWSFASSVVLEEVIEQHEALAKLHPQSVNGIRVTTIRIGDEVHIYYPWFKVGADGNFVTGGAQGSILAGIDSKTGVVDVDGCKESGERFECHPQTGIKFKGYAIPQWEELIKFAKEIAMKLDTINYVGWDLVLTENDGWCIMEGNASGEFLWQMNYDKGMKKEFQELIGWKPDKEFWWQK